MWKQKTPGPFYPRRNEIKWPKKGHFWLQKLTNFALLLYTAMMMCISRTTLATYAHKSYYGVSKMCKVFELTSKSWTTMICNEFTTSYVWILIDLFLGPFTSSTLNVVRIHELSLDRAYERDYTPVYERDYERDYWAELLARYFSTLTLCDWVVHLQHCWTLTRLEVN